MTSAVDIQIVSPVNLQKLESFFKDVSYRESIEISANFNTRLCIERRLRLPFLDPQTGVAQSPSQLYMHKRQRMPGFRAGQLYTYPAARWRKSRRQYLNKLYGFPERPFQGLRKDAEALLVGGYNHSLTGSPSVGVSLESSELNGSLLEESSSLGAFGGDTSDSKDSQQHAQQQQQQQQQQQLPQQLKEDLPKEWFYDDMDMNDVDSLEEPKSPADDEYDYDPRYGSKKRRKRRPGKRASLMPGEMGSGRRRTGSGRGRISAANVAAATAAADTTIASQLDSTDGLSIDLGIGTPTSSGRRPRGQGGTRGRRRTKPAVSKSHGPLSPGMIIEPPSFESAAAAVGVSGGSMAVEEHVDMRNYPKFL